MVEIALKTLRSSGAVPKLLIMAPTPQNKFDSTGYGAKQVLKWYVRFVKEA